MKQVYDEWREARFAETPKKFSCPVDEEARLCQLAVASFATCESSGNCIITTVAWLSFRARRPRVCWLCKIFPKLLSLEEVVFLRKFTYDTSGHSTSTFLSIIYVYSTVPKNSRRWRGGNGTILALQLDTAVVILLYCQLYVCKSLYMIHMHSIKISKPTNVLIDANIQVVPADFGISRLILTTGVAVRLGRNIDNGSIVH